MTEKKTKRSSGLAGALAQLRRPRPVKSDVYGELEITPLIWPENKPLQALGQDKSANADAFVRSLIQHQVRRPDSRDELSPAEVERLITDPVFLESVIEALPELYEQPKPFPPFKGEKDNLDESLHATPVLMREQDEDPSSFLLRAALDDRRRAEAQRAALSERLGSNILSDQLSASGLSAMIAGRSASDNLSKMINGLRDAGPSVGGRMDPFRPFDYEIPELPPNPIHETNDHLEELVRAIIDMRRLAVETATMQQSLHAVASDILSKFAVAAAESAHAAEENHRASQEALSVARYSLYAAVAGVAVAVLLSIVQLFTTGSSSIEKAHQARMEKLVAENVQAAEVQGRLLEKVSHQMNMQYLLIEKTTKEAKSDQAEQK